jgi:C4-dicarboxylate-specific signal transduction histidine kinase
MPQTELASANGVPILRQLSASIGEINQPISAVVMNAEAALRLLLAQPTDAEAVGRLLACIVKDGMRTGDIVNRTYALIKESAATEGTPWRSTLWVRMKLAKDLPPVQGDRVQLLRVMVSLIINAIETVSPHAAGNTASI